MAHAAIDRLSFDNNGILADDCEASAALCGTAGPIFKGIFIRNLRYLYEATRDPFLRDFILKNAESIIKNDVQAIDGVMGLRWAGPIVGSPNPSTHSAAMDALVAAVAIAG
jgi:predicted alpha-1,6-mannanase (GH76 family)